MGGTREGGSWRGRGTGGKGGEGRKGEGRGEVCQYGSLLQQLDTLSLPLTSECVYAGETSRMALWKSASDTSTSSEAPDCWRGARQRVSSSSVLVWL